VSDPTWSPNIQARRQLGSCRIFWRLAEIMSGEAKMRSSLKLASALLITLAFPFFGIACVASPDAEDAIDEASPAESAAAGTVADTAKSGTAVEALTGCGCGCSGAKCAASGCGAHGGARCSCRCAAHSGAALGTAGCACSGHGCSVP
jgi:hypothetical protein